MMTGRQITDSPDVDSSTEPPAVPKEVPPAGPSIGPSTGPLPGPASRPPNLMFDTTPWKQTKTKIEIPRNGWVYLGCPKSNAVCYTDFHPEHQDGLVVKVHGATMTRDVGTGTKETVAGWAAYWGGPGNEWNFSIEHKTIRTNWVATLEACKYALELFASGQDTFIPPLKTLVLKTCNKHLRDAFEREIPRLLREKWKSKYRVTYRDRLLDLYKCIETIKEGYGHTSVKLWFVEQEADIKEAVDLLDPILTRA
ncbi:hypothetical protein BO70DRAFT_366799 [Aspergillus heteromorphus CBS 117.55]|uniref:RNase H type-1 domain-containing protein n=1 Tax=Aspergillus heteromorphus CBS 117.55 TaxID=1448321 RepID=A0A317UUX9_9EURO|nr:uncharacterized protein BO70DRAFT_366799 [Aspergillus heteromorphus CBS 117.55]PWY65216.1 hypothetical protein BO70DRAFT_366799 [Aspergillus heteromorphus CBS 117.55]